MTERAVPDLTQGEPAIAGEPDTTFPAHHSDAQALHGARNSRVIWVLLVATFVVILNETIMSVAIPHLVIDLGITSERGAVAHHRVPADHGGRDPGHRLPAAALHHAADLHRSR